MSKRTPKTPSVPFLHALGGFDLKALSEEGYAVGAIQIGSVTMHVVVLRVTVNDEGWIEYTGTTDGGDSDLDAILALMGDGAGTPALHTYDGHKYLIGCMPYGN